MRYIRSFAVVSSALLLFGAGCGRQDNAGTAPQAQKPIPLVKTVIARSEAPVQWFEVTGDVVANNPVGIRATVDGPVSFCPWREGDTVDKGGRLIEIDRPVYREDVRTAEAALAVAQARLADLQAGTRPEEIAQVGETVKQFEECTGFAASDMKRIAQMVESGSLPGEEMEKARLAYVKCSTQLVAAQEKLQMLKTGPTKTALAVQEALVKETEARVERAKATVAECVLTAPFASVVTRVYVRPGDLATAKAPLLDLIEQDSLVVRFSIPEAQSAAVRKDTAVTITFDALPGRKIDSRVVRVYPEVDPGTRTRLIEAAVPSELGVVPGMFARVGVAVRTHAAAVLVPESALVVLPGGETVVFVVVDEKAERRQIKVAMESGGLIAVASGIEPGERVIVQGNDALKNGALVKVMEQKKKDGGGPGKAETASDSSKPAGADKEAPAL